MSDDTITKLPDSSGILPNPLSEVIRESARKLIEQAIEVELAALPATIADQKLDDGRARLVRHGHLPERENLTGVGPVAVKVPRVQGGKPGADKITFMPSILPRYLRKAKSVEELLPSLYLKGVSTGDFSEALAALLGPNARGLSAKTVTRLKADWGRATRPGRNATSVRGGFSTSGRMASPSSRGWPSKNNAPGDCGRDLPLFSEPLVSRACSPFEFHHRAV